MNLGLDYSSGRPGGAAIRAAGYTFVVRYLDNGITGRTNIDAAEFADLRAAGVDVALVWESAADRATAGHDAGVADAQAAWAAAGALGAGEWPVYFAVDFDIPDYAPAATSPLAKLGPVGDYFVGAASVLPHSRVGVYGGFYAVSRVLNAGLASLAWQTMAWSGGQTDPRVQLLQRTTPAVTVNGVACDVNEQHSPYFGQGLVTSAPPTPGDTVFQFVCDTSKFATSITPPPSPLNLSDKQTTNASVLLLLGGGYAVPAAWADVQAKDHTYGGDGTGSVLGLDTAAYQRYVDLDHSVRARDVALAGLTPGSGGGATPAQVTAIVDTALGSLHGNTQFTVG